ncbi:hypothetical protein C8J57DRAFT_1215414 [Mycena rebaudengoi]|nr:hypothetical protein C8J57DRAFT_1215414 [Mycena rebaudengoi]
MPDIAPICSGLRVPGDSSKIRGKEGFADCARPRGSTSGAGDAGGTSRRAEVVTPGLCSHAATTRRGSKTQAREVQRCAGVLDQGDSARLDVGARESELEQGRDWCARARQLNPTASSSPTALRRTRANRTHRLRPHERIRAGAGACSSYRGLGLAKFWADCTSILGSMEETQGLALDATSSTTGRDSDTRWPSGNQIGGEQDAGSENFVFLAELATIEVFEMAHFADGLRKMVSVLEDDRLERAGRRRARIEACVEWARERLAVVELAPDAQYGVGGDEEEMDIAMVVADGPSDELGAFDDAFHHFEVSHNLSAFDSTSMRAILDVGHQKTEEALLQLGILMSPPEPAPKPSRTFRSFKLPLLLNRGDKSLLRLPFLPDDLNSLFIRSEIPYSILALNGSTRISPLSPRQLAEF